LAETDFLLGRMGEGHQHLDEAVRLAEELDDPKSRIRAIWQRAVEHQITGTASGGADDLRAAIALAEEIEDAEDTITGCMRLGVFLYNAGDLAGAETELERAAALAQEQGSLRRLSWLTFYLGAVRLHRGPRDKAAENLKNAVEWL